MNRQAWREAESSLLNAADATTTAPLHAIGSPVQYLITPLADSAPDYKVRLVTPPGHVVTRLAYHTCGAFTLRLRSLS